jgi:hypothetical protein
MKVADLMQTDVRVVTAYMPVSRLSWRSMMPESRGFRW